MPDSGDSLSAGETEGVRKFLTFRSGYEKYGIDIVNIQEILEVSSIPAVARIPNLPAYVKGVMNLRGTLLPVIELRAKLGFPPFPYGERAALVVLRLERGVVGIIVEVLGDMVSLPESELSKPDAAGLNVRPELIECMGHVAGNVVLILNVDQLFSPEEMAQPTLGR